MDVRSIFVNRHSEMRAGWRILLFLILATALTFGTAGLVKVAGLSGALWGPLAFLLGVLVASLVMTRYVNRKPFTAIGLSFHRGTFREFGVGFGVGFLMMAGIFAVEFGFGFVEIGPLGFNFIDVVWLWASSLALFGVAALFEEVLFRGYLFQTMIQGMTFLPALSVMALAFALIHLGNPHATAYAMVNVALASIWFSFAYMKTRGLWLPWGLHFGWNFSQTSIFSFPTSGIDFANRRLFPLVQRGPEWLTGGAFGPEGGVLATLALVVGTGYILKSKSLEAQEGIVTLDSVEDLLRDQAHLREDAA